MANNLLTIPSELGIHILSKLDAVSLARCAMTCKSIYETIKSSSLLEYTLHLHFDGLKHVGTSTSHPELIKSLLLRRQAWLSLKFTGYTTYNMPHIEICRAYEFIGGVFAVADRQHLQIVWLPTPDNPEYHRLHTTLTGFSVQELTMDPTQDMIALLEATIPRWQLPTDLPLVCRIHIRTISTSTTHPLAQQDVLHFTVPSDFSHYTKFSLEVAHNILVVVLTCISGENQAWVWDWTTSDLRMDTSVLVDSLYQTPIFNFRLLDSTFFFVTSLTGSGSIWLYELVHSPCSTDAPAIHLATLHLPSTASKTKISEIHTSVGPIEARSLSYTPLMVTDEDRLHAFMVVYTQGYKSYTLNIFVHQRVFTKYILQKTRLGAHPPRDIPWEEWGPSNTRIVYPDCIKLDYSWLMRRHIHGQRVVIDDFFYSASGRRNVLRSMTILDFSLAAILHAKGNLPMFKSPPSLTFERPGKLLLSTTLRAEQAPLFENDVETHLQCVSHRREFEWPYSTYMIHSDGIVGVDLEPQTMDGLILGSVQMA